MPHEPVEIFPSDPEDTRQSIMKATYGILCERGYDGLSMQRVADRVGIEKASLYYHYDGKDDLLKAFLDFLTERLVEVFPLGEHGDAEQDLRTALDSFFLNVSDAAGDEEATFMTPDFARAYVELRAQAAHDEEYRRHFTESERRIETQLAGLIDRGIEEGVFRPVDSHGVAEYLLYNIEGVIFRAATSDEGALEAARTELDAYIDGRIVTDDEAEPTA